MGLWKKVPLTLHRRGKPSLTIGEVEVNVEDGNVSIHGVFLNDQASAQVAAKLMQGTIDGLSISEKKD